MENGVSIDANEVDYFVEFGVFKQKAGQLIENLG